MPGFAPKLRVLTSSETQVSLDTWRETLLFHLTLDGSFEEFLEEGSQWESAAFANRGLAGDDPKEKTDAKTAKQKVRVLNLMLGTIASYAPVISREFIVGEAESLDAIFARLRIHYGFRKSGGLILDLASISHEEGESYEALWERIYAFFSDNMLQPADGMLHKKERVSQKEEMTPTLVNTMVVLWLKTINPGLPAVVKQKYTSELRNQTLASIREDISESLESILAELVGESACIARASYSRNSQKKGFNSASAYRPPYSKQRSHKFCCLCEAKGRKDSSHYLSECPFLPDSDKRFMSYKARSRAVDTYEESEAESDQEEGGTVAKVSVKSRREEHCCQHRCEPAKDESRGVKSTVRKVDVVSSPYI